MEISTQANSYLGRNFGISERKILGSFSVNRERDKPNREYLPDCSQLKFLLKGIASTRVEYDLNYNAKTTVSRTDVEQDVGFLCHYLKDNKHPIDIFDSGKISLDDAPFVTLGESLRVIGSLPYKQMDDVFISVSLVKGVVYLLDWCKNKSVSSLSDMKAFGWGHKFKQHILADECNTPPDKESPLIEGKEFYLVHRAKLEEHHLLYATNIDAVICEKSDNISKKELTVNALNSLEFVQLKINGFLKDVNTLRNFKKYKSMSWWLDAHLTGVNKVLCGHRDKEGVVTELKYYETATLHGTYRESWHPQVPFNFCHDFLGLVKKCLSQELFKRHGEHLDDIRNLPKIDLIFERKPLGNIRLCNDVEHASIIPEWFIDLFKKE